MIVAFMSAVSFGVSLIAKKHPGIIAGFRWSDTPEGIERDKRWLQLFHRNMNLSAAITLAGGILSVLAGSDVLFMAFMMLPVSIASVHAAVNSPSKKKTAPCHKRMKTVVAISAVLLMMVPFAYFYVKDLEVAFEVDCLKIAGIYGTTIKYGDILQVEERRALPALSHRSNGLGLGKVRIGYFVAEDGSTIRLFVHSDSCFVFIKDKTGQAFYLSKKEKEATSRIYEAIVLKAGR